MLGIGKKYYTVNRAAITPIIVIVIATNMTLVLRAWVIYKMAINGPDTFFPEKRMQHSTLHSDMNMLKTEDAMGTIILVFT